MEAVVTLPLLLLLLLVGVEFGRTFVQYTTLANAVRQSARLVASEALLGTTQTVFISPALITRARNLVVFGNEAGTGSPRLPRLVAGQVTIRDAGGNNVEVSVTYPYEPMFGPTLRTFGADKKVIELEVLAHETILHYWQCIIGDLPSVLGPSRPTLMDAMQVCATELDNWLTNMRQETIAASNLCGRILTNAVGDGLP